MGKHVCLQKSCGDNVGRKDDRADTKTGPAALLRNVLYLLKTSGGKKRIILCDRFYTSVVGFIHLMTIGFYAAGTIITNRLGFPKSVVMEKKRKLDRGTSRIIVSRAIPTLCALSWYDNKPVHFVSTGLANRKGTVNRQVGGEKKQFPVPMNLSVYQHNMGGVDTHDQLRLARYSIQRHFAFKKWYRITFLTLVLLFSLCLLSSLWLQ